MPVGRRRGQMVDNRANMMTDEQKAIIDALIFNDDAFKSKKSYPKSIHNIRSYYIQKQRVMTRLLAHKFIVLAKNAIKLNGVPISQHDEYHTLVKNLRSDEHGI